MAKRRRGVGNRPPPDWPAFLDPAGWPDLDVFAHGPLGEILERFAARLREEAVKVAGARVVNANHLEQAYQRLLSPSLADWSLLNRRRVFLIRKEEAGGLSPAESAELAALQADADRHMSEVAPRPFEALWDARRELGKD